MFYLIDLFGTAVFAISGAVVASRKEMDIFGALVLATVTATGGGTLRDLFLGRHPLARDNTGQGLLRCLYELQEMLKEVTGMRGVSLTPPRCPG